MFNAGAVIAKFTADLTEFKNGLNTVRNDLSGMASNFSGIGTKIGGFFGGIAKSIGGTFTSAVQQAQSMITTFMASVGLIGGALSAVGIVNFFKSASEEAKNFEKAMISLGIIAERFGQSSEKAKQSANELATELNLGVGASAEALQNLLKSGLNIDQASDLIRRFTNEALTGKSANISLSQAVQNLAFAYATGNSALGNMSGISENWINIIDNGKTVLSSWNGGINESAGITQELADQIKAYEAELKSQGKTLDANNDEQAKYIGLLKLTNLTMGSSQKFAGTLIDAQAKLEKKVVDLKIAIGNELNPILAEMTYAFAQTINVDAMSRAVGVFMNVLTSLLGIFKGEDLNAELTEALTFFTGDNWAQAETIAGILTGFVEGLRSLSTWVGENKDLVLTFIQGLVIALGGLLIIATITSLITALTNPIVLVVGAVALLYTAWQQNFLGIRDITQQVLDAIMGFWNKHKEDFEYILNGIKQAIQWFIKQVQDWWKLYGDNIVAVAKAMWELIKTLFSSALDIIIGIVKFFVALFKGDWQGMWDAVKQIVEAGWNVVKAIFNTFATVAGEALKALWDTFTSWFTKIWDKAKEYAEKIRHAISDAFNADKRNSPSIRDRINEIKDIAEGVLSSISVPAFSHDISNALAGIVATQNPIAGIDSTGLGSSRTVNQYVTANIKDELDVQTLSERLAFGARSL